MTATYTFDVFTSLDGLASYGPPADWGGYWGKQGPEFLAHRLAVYDGDQRMVFGATTFGMFLQMLPLMTEERDAWMDQMIDCPTTVISSTLQGPVDWPDATVLGGDGVEIVRRMKEESDVPIRSHGSLSLNRALMAAGLVDRIQLTVFPVVAAQTGDEPVFAGAGDFDLDLLETRTFDGRTQELIYRPTLRTWPVGPDHRS
ncbi:dihydrofolate reductase family protein [uncultured Friedmanniella sp.]|uniref:dihydrofolate reductase family protein n=1 Tax=uncultured Friedmanniella sp. TaxID=335381 RepID=UPI0035CA4A27